MVTTVSKVWTRNQERETTIEELGDACCSGCNIAWNPPSTIEHGAGVAHGGFNSIESSFAILWSDQRSRGVVFFERTTKRPISSRISCHATLAENNYVRLSSRKVACRSVATPTSTGNTGSVYTR